MVDLLTLSEMEDEELVPEILPVNARLSISSQATVLSALFASAHDVTPSKEIIPYTSYTRLEALEGRIRVSATDGERAVAVASRTAIVRLTGECLLPGKKILDILKLVPEQTVRIDVIGDVATIRSSSAVWTIKVPPVEANFPGFASVEGVTLHEVSRLELLNALELVLPAVSRTTARQSLMQAELTKGTLTSCDGVRAHRVKLDVPNTLNTTLPFRFIESAIRELRGSSDETVGLGSNHSTVVLRLGSSVLMAQRLNFEFPAVNPLVLGPALANDEHLYVDKLALESAIRRVRINSDPEYMALFLSVRKVEGKWLVIIRARDKAGNASQEAVKADYQGPAKSKDIAVNHKYFLEFLACISEEELDLRLGENTKTKVAPIYVETEDFVGSLQPMAPNVAK